MEPNEEGEDMTGKCYWYEDQDTAKTQEQYCNIMDTHFISCLGEIYLCECDEQRKAEERYEALDRNAEWEREGR